MVAGSIPFAQPILLRVHWASEIVTRSGGGCGLEQPIIVPSFSDLHVSNFRFVSQVDFAHPGRDHRFYLREGLQCQVVAGRKTHYFADA